MAAAHILVVEDEADIRELVRYNLERAGYRVDCVGTGEAALREARATLPALMVLDLMLPGTDGLSVCRTLKRDPATHAIAILMLTARGAEADVVNGLESGADDYVVKPFSPRVLVARARSLLRRVEEASGTLRTPAAPAANPHPAARPPEAADARELHHHGIGMHPGRRAVTVGAEKLDLTRTEFDLLYFLLRRPGWVFTRGQIVDAIKGEGHPVTERSVDVQVAAIRKKLGAAGRVIETVRGVGYRVGE
ncbi:MAG: response regulator transcription factor [Nitrospirota bacterium]|nr:response regulator transcription factor [Nitrospirota bacterium]